MKILSYDWNNFISTSDINAICSDVEMSINNGRFFQNSPRYQTNFNVFQLTDSHWMKLKMSFIMSVFMYLEKEVRIKNIQSWSYMTSLKYPEARERLWHNHKHDSTTESMSGVFYLKVPVMDEDCGTEFAPNGPEKSERHWEKPKVGQWIVYPSEYWHRPGILKSEENRFIVAADLHF